MRKGAGSREGRRNSSVVDLKGRNSGKRIKGGGQERERWGGGGEEEVDDSYFVLGAFRVHSEGSIEAVTQQKPHTVTVSDVFPTAASPSTTTFTT